jgi:CheY-like chemotaxis protein
MDDDPRVRDVMRRQLIVLGFEVVAVGDGREAVTAYRGARESGRPYNGVFLDLQVDTGWGGERTLLELLRIDPGVRALVCSAMMTKPTTEYERQGFCGVLPKPYSLGDLRRIVDEKL